MQDGRKAPCSILYVSVAFFPSLKQNFIAYHYYKVSWHPDCIFDIHELWQSGFSRVYSNCCCSCWFEPEIIKIGQSSYKMYSNNILNFQVSMTILNACTKKFWNLIECTTYIYQDAIKLSWWISLTLYSLPSYQPSLLTDIPDRIPCRHRTDVWTSLLISQHWSILRRMFLVLFVLLRLFVR